MTRYHGDDRGVGNDAGRCLTARAFVLRMAPISVVATLRASIAIAALRFGNRLLGSVRNTARHYPFGWWRCTHSAGWCAKIFEAGKLYQCRPDFSGSPRIYPDNGGCWAPYWESHNNRFCYPPSDIEFEYIGATRLAA